MNLFFNVPRARRAVGRACLVAVVGLSAATMAAAQSVAGISIKPSSVVGGVKATATVTLTKAAGVDGVSVRLASLSDYAMVPQTVSVTSGSSSATFTITTSPVPTDTSAAVSATTGDVTKSASLTLKAPKITSLALSPTLVNGGASSTGTVKISSPAPAAGLPIMLASNQGAASAGDSVVIEAGATSGTFTVTTVGVATKTVAKITASLNSTSIGVSLTINPPVISKLTLDPATVVGGSTSTGTVTLSGSAPGSGAVIKLTATGNNATVPVTVTIEGGATSGSFTITTKAVTTKTSSTIGAKFGTSNTTAALTITGVPVNKYAGTYNGSFLSDSGDIGSVDLVVSATGAIAGSSVDGISGTKTPLSGTIDNSGNATITISNANGTSTSTGTFMSAGSVIYAQFSDSGTGGKTFVTLNLSGRLLMFKGLYSGTFNGGQGSTGTVKLTIAASGQIIGSYVGDNNSGNGTIKGNVAADGVAKLTVTNSKGTNTQTAYAAFNSQGQLIVVVIDTGSAANTVLTLTQQ